jgi:predicted MPP superfamily phosphohydrolase
MHMILAVGMLLVAFAYIGLRTSIMLGRHRAAKALTWSVLGVMLVCSLWFPAARFLPFDLDPAGFEVAQAWITYLPLGIMLMFCLAFLGCDLAWIVAWAITRASRARAARPLDGGRPDRRSAPRSLWNVATVFVAVALCGGTFFGARRRARVVDVEVPIHGLPGALEGFRIVQISDFHVGNTVTRSSVESVVECINDLGGDLVAITGDLTDGTVDSLRADVEPLGRLRARHGVFFVTGNHDYYYGNGREWVAEVHRLGLTPLVNEHRVIEHDGGTLVVVGVPDPMDSSAPMLAAPAGDVRILLAHRPSTIEASAAAGFDLQLSGHTHGGQVFPFHAFALLRHPFVSGLHQLRGTWVYVSRGTGYWGPPFRLFAPSEITVLTLVRG